MPAKGADPILPGDILLVSTPTIWGALIRWFTRSEWSHAALYVGDGRVAEVDATAATHIGLLTYERYIVLHHPGLTDGQRAAMVRWVTNQVGGGYDWGAIAEIALRLLSGVRACVVARHRWICTELVLDAYRAAGVNLAACAIVTPAEMLALPGLEVVTDAAAPRAS